MELRKLLIAAVILAALSGAVWYTKQHPPAPSSTTPAAPSTNGGANPAVPGWDHP